MLIIEVISSGDKKEFLDFPRRLYKDDPNWVCLLDSELESIFDPEKNYLFRQGGEASRWILRMKTVIP